MTTHADPGIDTALARLLHDLGQVELPVLQAGLEEVRQRRTRDPGVTLAGLLRSRGQASAAVLDQAVARLRPLDEAILANSLGSVDPNPLAAPAPARFGPYRVVRELARGGMGAVYEVVDERSQTRYALKTLLGVGDGEGRIRFQREVEAMGQLDHPHVVRVHAAETQTNPPYLVQDLLSGGTLADLLRTRPLPPADVIEIGVKLCAALAHCHERSVLHRDLKPSNVMLDERGQPKLVDFGLVRDLADDRSRLTQTGELLGTPGYLAPEQARADRVVDARTDVYGLGATLFALLSGNPPFRGRGLAGLAAVVHDPPPSLCALNPDVSSPLATVIERALAKEPERRFPDMTAFAQALTAVAGGVPPRAWPVWPLALVALLLPVGLWATQRPSPPPDPDPTPQASATPMTPAPPSASPTPPLDEASRSKLKTARGHLKTPGIESASSALAALRGVRLDLAHPASKKFVDALQAAVDRRLPIRAEPAVKELKVLLEIASLLPGRPPLPPDLWERTWRSATDGRILGVGGGFGKYDDHVHELLADLDPTNLDLQERVLGNSILVGSKTRFLSTAKRLVAHAYRDPARRLAAQTLLAWILGHKRKRSPQEVTLLLQAAETVQSQLAQARREGWKVPAGDSVRGSLPPKRSWLDVCEGLVLLALAQLQMNVDSLRAVKLLDRATRAVKLLDSATKLCTDEAVVPLRIQALERSKKYPEARQAAFQYVGGAFRLRQDHGSALGVCWRIYLSRRDEVPTLRRLLAKLLSARGNSLRFVCLAWLDHVAKEPSQRDDHLQRSVRMLEPELKKRRKQSREPGSDWELETQRRAALLTRIKKVLVLLEQGDPTATKTLEELAKACGERWY